MNEFDFAAAKIQSRIANFLLLKEQLIRLSEHYIPEIKLKAKVLLTVQNPLEEKLATTLSNIEKFKSGGWTTSDVVNMMAFYAMMEKQIKDVSNLNEFAKTGQEPISAATMVKWALPIGIGLLVLMFLTKK